MICYKRLMRTLVVTGLLFLLGGTANAEIYRCGNSYSTQPCIGGKAVDVSPTLSNPSGPATKEIFLCRTKSDRLYWNHEHCSARGWSIERIARVPKDASWDEQVEIAKGQKRSAESAAAVPSYPSSARRADSAAASKKDNCQKLEDRVKQLDRQGRSGSRHYDLDWIREQRRLARDEQFRLRC